MRLSDLLGAAVTTESGRELGRVHDVRAKRSGATLEVTALVVGVRGTLERLGLEQPHRARPVSGGVVPWDAVLRADRRGIVVRD